MNKTAVAAGIVIIVILAGIALIVGMGPSAGGAKLSTLAIQLTDPPQVPAGTNALVIAYSSAQVHTSGGAGSGWISASGSGSIDLMSVLNLSQTIATASVANGTDVDMVRFNVSSAHITINGTTYNVTVPSRQVTARVGGETTVNGTSSVLLSLSPVVATIITQNSTVYVLVPSVKAIIVGSSGASLSVGARESIRADVEDRLNRTTPKITLSNASISVSGNTTSISVTVTNNANQSVDIKHMGIKGNETVHLNFSAIAVHARANAELHLNDTLEKLNQFCASNSTQNRSQAPSRPIMPARPDDIGIGINVSASGGFQASQNSSSEGEHSGESGNVSTSANASVSSESERESNFNIGEGFKVSFNSSICANLHAQVSNALTAQINAQLANFSAKFKEQQATSRFVVLSINSTGAMQIPSSEDDVSEAGYILQPGQSFTFSFNGEMQAAEGHMVITPTAGAPYKVAVQGDEGVAAVENVTAT
ncbi:MAG: DUF4382 domain-containing protein [Candidatus Micrarchaeota archaeon]|nr:DUF4382 domain-containing protein [Candidatus Micrarchaeota archaeon]